MNPKDFTELYYDVELASWAAKRDFMNNDTVVDTPFYEKYIFQKLYFYNHFKQEASNENTT